MADADGQLALPLRSDDPLALVVRESARAKRLTLQAVPHEGVEMVVPSGTPANVIESFARRNRAWIERQSRRLAEEFPVAERALPLRIELAALGRAWSVHYDAPAAKRRELKERADRLELRCSRDDTPRGRPVLQSWLQQLGRKRLVPALERAGHATGLQFKQAQVRGQRTRWGSYSQTGTISLNYGLLFLPPDLVRYLFLHELCHTVHTDHSHNFWALVNRYEPNYRRMEKRLDAAWRSVPAWVGLY